MTYSPARLRSLIESRGLTFAEVAKAAGVSRQAVHEVVSGGKLNPGIFTVERIVTAAGLTMIELYGGED